MNTAIKNTALAILRPLVRFLIGHGWTFGAISELLKYVCVEEACRRHGDGARVLTDSKVTLMSGVHRKEVRRIREELAQTDTHNLPLRHGANIAAQLITLWMTHPNYQNDQGEPLCLPMRAHAAPSVEELARLIKADMRPRTIVDDLVRAGVAAERADLICLLRCSYISNIPEDRLVFMGNNVGDHLSAAVHNLEGSEPAYLEQAMYFDELPPEALATLRPELRRLAEKLLRDAYQRVAKLAPPDESSPNDSRHGSRRMRLGVYYFEEEIPQIPQEHPKSHPGDTSKDGAHVQP
ncbi:MAG: DUF6502 family protein [Halothiobacillus sp.]